MNLPIHFNYTVSDIKNIEKEIIQNNNNWLQFVKESTLTPEDFLESYLYKDKKFDYIYHVIHFLKYVVNDHKIKKACSDFELNIKKYFTNFYKSEENYKLFLILNKIKINKNDPNNKKKLIKNILKNFKYNGVHLPKNQKNEFIKIDEQLNIIENKFSENIINDIQKIKFKKEDLIGISEELLKSHKKGTYYIFDTTYPDESVIMKDCTLEKSRKRMYITYNSVAKENINLLENIIKLREQRSKIFGFKSSVQFYLSENRIAKEANINSLLNKLIPILKKKAFEEYNQLLKIANKKYLYDYDLAYYSNLYKKTYLNYDENIIKNYFPSNYTINAILQIYGDLFNITIKKINESDEKYWNEDVDLYIVHDKDTKHIIGYFYLDLYPRKGKFTHAATFELQNSYQNQDGKRIIPITAIVCNFTKPEFGKDFSLFKFGEIVTFCHEFGHALHNIFANVKYENLSGISVERDFSEMPSQFFENWCYQHNFLKKITKHYITSEKISDEMIEHIIKNKNYLCGIHYLTQILYIKYDLDLHNKQMINKKYVYNHWFELCNQLLPFKATMKTFPMCRFDHIIDYASGYYGYLWSIIYAYDAFSLFESEGLFNQELGTRFRKEILEKGSVKNGNTILIHFLKRKKNNKNFFKIFV